MTPTTNQPVKPIEAPTGVDLHPKWAGIVRLSKRAALIVGVVVLLVVVGCLYGVFRRSVEKMQMASQGEPKRITPATQAGQEMASFKDSRPAAAIGKLVPPTSAMAAQSRRSSCSRSGLTMGVRVLGLRDCSSASSRAVAPSVDFSSGSAPAESR